jgi:hypothetical protein
MPAKRKATKQNDNKATTTKDSNPEVRDEMREHDEEHTNRYQLNASECVPKLMTLAGQTLAQFSAESDTSFVYQGVQITVREANPDKLSLVCVTGGDEDVKFGEAKAQTKHEINKHEDEIKCLQADTQKILLQMQGDHDIADQLGIQLGKNKYK